MNQQIENWLLEEDNPPVRYFTLRYLFDRPEDDPEAQAARRAIMDSEPVKKSWRHKIMKVFGSRRGRATRRSISPLPGKSCSWRSWEWTEETSKSAAAANI